jgi:hypothetical protein
VKSDAIIGTYKIELYPDDKSGSNLADDPVLIALFFALAFDRRPITSPVFWSSGDIDK